VIAAHKHNDFRTHEKVLEQLPAPGDMTVSRTLNSDMPGPVSRFPLMGEDETYVARICYDLFMREIICEPELAEHRHLFKLMGFHTL
jgi:hypothetical protein